MIKPINEIVLNEVLESIDITDVADATIRQLCDIAYRLEKRENIDFLHLEMGIPGLAPERVGVDAEIAALHSGIASIYPNIHGIPQLKSATSHFIKAFLDVDVPESGCIPTVGSMQGSFSLFLLCSQLYSEGKKVLFLDPGFPVQRLQAEILNVGSVSFDVYNYRDDKLGDKLESILCGGEIGAIVYSNPNNPAWICLTDRELQMIGELATKYDAIVIEDLAYMCMDFRKPLGKPFEAPFQSTVAKYTNNYILMLSGSKIFSYAGQRIGVVAISESIYNRSFENLKRLYGISKFGDALVLKVLYAISSGVSHSAQYALAAMFKAAADGDLDFVGKAHEYARRAKISKEIFLRYGFHIVYDKDLDEDVSDGFFYTVGYGKMTSGELIRELLMCGIAAISLTSTGSSQSGVRICISQMNKDVQFEELDKRLSFFKKKHN